MDERPVLVTGATGYVGGRLVPLLLERGFRVRAAVRSLEKIRTRPWGRHERLQAVLADLRDQDSLERAMQGCQAAYYLVHSMRPDIRDFRASDREAAYNMVAAAKRTSLPRIIYLGGLGDNEPHLSEHLRSRAEVGRILSLGSTPATILRAAMILGSGSASFEILRYLVDRLPVILTPKWVYTKCQPISIRNVLRYLIGCLERPETVGQTYDIGGPDVLSYFDLFRIYAEEAGLRRRKLIPVPVISPALSAYWVSLITPVPVPLVRPLVHGLRNEVVCRETRIRELIPQELMTCREAIRRALEKTKEQVVDTTCFDVGKVCQPEWASATDAPYAGGTVLEYSQAVLLEGSLGRVWEPIERIGGFTGWYSGDRLWKLRGFLDRLLTGPGHVRGRRHPVEIAVGDALDFWRVLDVVPERRLLLAAEMRLPGEALLEFTLSWQMDTETELVMTAKFLPRGVGGVLYWWGLYPVHALLFRNMLLNIARAANVRILAGPYRVRKAEKKD